MNFLAAIFERLRGASARPVLQEVRAGSIFSATGGDLLAAIRAARAFLTEAGLRQGDRCALLAPNSIRWAATDLALMAEGVLVVPLYARQAPGELVAMMKDCSPSLLICGDAALRVSITQLWSDAPRAVLFDEIFAPNTEATVSAAATMGPPRSLCADDPVTIIYTSGTSGEAKGVVLSVGNLNHMLRCTTERLDLLMGPQAAPDHVFHYLPFCFAGSWILLLSCLSRNAVLTLSTDLTQLREEMQLAAPDYFLNVPALLERVRSGVVDQLKQRGGTVRWLYRNATAAWLRSQAGESSLLDSLRLALGRSLLFPSIRRRLGTNLKALICGSAPLSKETQLFFHMLGIPVLQVYGLTETTAICTMDHPERIEPGRVGPAIPGMEMKRGEDGEILVRGSNVFQGYWGRPQATAEVLRDGWFHTGDQGEVNGSGNWSVTGRIKNLLILSSGHNVPPEPIEDELLRALPGAQQVVLVGNGRSYLAALITGAVSAHQADASIEAVNQRLPHYQRVHAFHLCEEPFTVENGLLTVNGKLKRAAIETRYRDQIETMYRKEKSGARSQNTGRGLN